MSGTQQEVRKFGGKAWRLVAGALCVAIAVAATSGAQTVVQVPFAAVGAGLAPGTTAAVCSTELDSVGDGCPASQASMSTALQAVWTDNNGNIYIGDYNNYRLRVIYHGGAALAAVLAANNPTMSGPPQAGYVYSIGGAATSVFTGTYCNGVSGTKYTDTTGSGCPAYEAFIRPVGGDTDAYGDIYYREGSNGQTIRVIYAGGAPAAKIIQLDAGVTAPVIGSVYRIGGLSSGSSGHDGDGGLATSAHFRNPHSLVLDVNNNVFIADTGNNVVRRIDATTGIVNIFAGGAASGCSTGTATTNICPATFTGDGAVATAATLNGPYEVAVDKSGNVYIADSGNLRVRVVYAGGTVPGLSGLTPGFIYTLSGGGTGTTSGTAAVNLKYTLPRGVSLDATGNVYVSDYSGNKIWRVDAQTGLGTVYGGGGAATTIGVSCSGTSGPKATDKVGDGCPATLAPLAAPFSRLVFDENNVGYIAEVTNSIVRSFTFNERFPVTSVGSTSTLPLALTDTASFAAPTVNGLAQNVGTSEFTAAPVTCTPGTTYPAGTVCTYNLQFSPSVPGSRVGSQQEVLAGSVVGSAGLDGTGVAALLGVAPTNVVKFAASITSPAGVAVDETGNIYVSDTSSGTLWKGTVGGTFTAAITGLSGPAQAAVDGLGSVYVADSGNNRVMELSAAGVVSTVVSGLSAPSGLLATGNGILYIANAGTNQILRYNTGKLVALGITGLSGPTALAIDGNQTLYIADTGNGRIVSYTTAGVQSVVPTGSLTYTPSGIAVDPAGDLYIADRISGSVYTLLAGSLTPTAIATGIASPSGIALDGSGRLFYADNSAAGVQEYNQQQATLTFPKTQMQQSSASQVAMVTNLGNAPLSFTSPTFNVTGNAADFGVSQGSGGCGTATVAGGGTCTVSAVFSPASTGLYNANVGFVSNAANTGTATILLTGTGVNLITTTTKFTLVSPASGSVTYSQTAVFNVAVTPVTVLSTGAPTGTIAVLLDGAAFQTITLSGTSVQISLNLPAGTHTISATYSGDNYYSSSHDNYTLVVLQQPTTTLLTYGTAFTTTSSTLTLTATVSPTLTGAPTGKVAFYNGTTLLATVTLSPQGVATYPTTLTTYPGYTFSAVYLGDANFATSTSSNLLVGSDFSVVPIGTSLLVAAGYPATTTLTLGSYFTYTGTLSFSCSGLPVNTICRFSPQTIALTAGASATETMEIFTDASAGVQTGGVAGLWSFATVLLLTTICFGGIKRIRNLLRSTPRLAVLLMVLAGLAGSMGCGKSSMYDATVTPAGTSTFTLTVQDTAGKSHSVNYALTVYSAN